ncbi:MAG: hypothetical protein M3N13_02015, partial [Candidatus Eremiobacteraeota bacterium]|nr:hypothetical protein [Candidatus Eremiobacteraeota bacterium]
VPPGSYTARLTADGRTFTQSFVVRADPKTQYTQAQLVRGYEFAKRGEAMYSTIDTMLNNLDTVQKSIDAATAAAKKANNTDAQAKLDAILTAKKSAFDFLTANFQNDEDSIELPGALREDVQFLQFVGGTVITPAIEYHMKRITAEYRRGVSGYNGFVKMELPALNEVLRSLNEKPVTIAEATL